jgi:hypothetical protein
MFGNLKNALMRKMIDHQLKKSGMNIPDEQKEMLLEMIEKNPELFTKISKEIEAGVKAGKNQMAVSMEVMRKYKSELEALKRS